MNFSWANYMTYQNVLITSLCKKCPNTEYFLVRIFPHSDWIQRDTSGKYGPENTPYSDTFYAVLATEYLISMLKAFVIEHN